MSKPGLLDEILWRDVPQEACRLAKKAAGPYQVIQDLMPSLPDIGAQVWYNPDEERAFVGCSSDADSDKQASWYIALRQVPGINEIEIQPTLFAYPPSNDPYIHVKQALDAKDVFQPLASAAQYEPNALNRLWGGPNPLAATLGGGLLGAGLGYGGGWLAEQLLPEDKFEKGVLRKNTALLGGLLGASPGVWHGFDQTFRGPNPGWGAWLRPFPWNKEAENRYSGIKEGLARDMPDATDLGDRWPESANEAGGGYAPIIPVDQFGQVIWNDLRTQGGNTPPPLAAATTGLVQAASLSRGGADLISPADIARIGMGMGSGYLSGMFVGKTLGALAGLRPDAQRQLQQAGVWAGILSNVVPLAFR
jgi:hypothetical protein